MKPTIVLGASENPERYSYKAIGMLLDYGHPVVAIGKSGSFAHGVEIQRKWPSEEHAHTVALYLNPLHQEKYIQNVLDLKPNRVIFNPGTENPIFAKLLLENGIEAIDACTLVMLRTGQF